ncbi:restriction endonuclease subunit S [Helcococcus kunzii]|uniref:restriction endonuclease subunit S n=1 Tax=Helcococcus kunzii TaxID=40091 RepID=UPI001C974269|nr:restriction endonuclease subunit S [Helcococcus kunzii]QZO76314.1 restriction endonuclease subunit S [Helcococcus kunzii]
MKYEKYKDSRIDWIGEIPEHWEINKGKHIYKITTGKLDANEYDEGGKYPFFTCSNENTWINTYAFDCEALLISGNGNVGFTRYYKGKFNAYQRVYVLYNFSENIDSDYLKYYTSSRLIPSVAKKSVGSVIEFIKLGDIKNFSICFPTKEEQNKIASYLDNKTAKIDAIINSLEDQRDKLERYKRELISETVTKGLKKNVSMKDSGVDWIGEIPEHWQIFPLFHLLKENKEKNAGMINSNLLSLSYGRIIKKDIDTTFGLLPASFEGYQIVDKDYIILRLTDLQNDKRSLRTGIVREKGIITSAYVGLKKSPIESNSEYLHYVLHAYDLKKVFYSMGSGLRQSLNFSDIKRIPLLFPPIDEQEKIVRTLNLKQQKIDSIKKKIKLQIEELKDYRKIIIYDAVTGKKKVFGGED